MRAYHLRSNSESGEAPYGDHIVVARNYWPFGQYLGDTVFAADSIGGVKYRWLTNHLLLIEYETEKIVKQMEKVGDIHIQYKRITPNHNSNHCFPVTTYSIKLQELSVVLEHSQEKNSMKHGK